MRFSFVPAAAAVLLLATPAIAQETVNWNGFYAGLNAGYGFSGSTTQTTGQAAVNDATVADGARRFGVRNELNGFIGGGAGTGYNVRFENMGYVARVGMNYRLGE